MQTGTMKVKIVLIAFLCLINTVATEANGNNYKGNFVISFYSIGSGKNGRAYTKFNSFIREFNSKNSPRIQYDIIDWGKEGEKDVCFHPNGNANFTEFIKQITELLKNEPMVTVKEHEECRKRE
ncbi:MAG: hypothetical protein JWO06_1502 [Bacteroidota bacterium]|nr:hypothetical protein [Bacteroidota bacterium]